MGKSVIGIVDTQQRAETIVQDLRQAGFALPDLSVLYPNRSGDSSFAFKNGTKAPEGATAGVSAGGALGGTLGLLAGLGAIAIPGLGPLIAAGPLLGALSGAAAGAAVGGVTGALVGMGIPEFEAKRYEEGLADGQILVAVHVESREAADSAREVLKRDGAHDVTSTRDAN
ncbi:MAG: DUF3341 domain-containing protein [Polyangiales bacterium]